MRLTVLSRAFAVLLLLDSTAVAQWLPDDVQRRERALWDQTGVEFPAGLRFYELPIVSQRLVGIVNYRPVDRYGIFDEHYRGAENVNAQYPWTTPAGLHASPMDQWRKAAAACFPSPVTVYRETVRVENGIKDKRTGKPFTQPQPHLAWTFPEGTVFAELLVRTYPDGREHAFEIRTRHKEGGRWHGTTYRPDVPLIDYHRELVPPGKLKDFGFGPEQVTLSYATKATWRLRPTRQTLTAWDDVSFVPRNYLGNVRDCQHCHEQAGKPTSYGATTIRGGDTVLSWHPFSLETVNTDKMPVLDSRWPLAGK
jgi:hypothetical protein